MPRVILAALSSLTDTYSHIYGTKDGEVAFADTIIMSIHDFSATTRTLQEEVRNDMPLLNISLPILCAIPTDVPITERNIWMNADG